MDGLKNYSTFSFTIWWQRGTRDSSFTHVYWSAYLAELLLLIPAITLWNFGLPVTKRVADILDFKICSIQFTFYALQLHFSSTKHTKFFIEIQMYKLQKVWHFEKHNSTLLMFGYAAFITAVSVWKLHKVRNKHLPTVSPKLQLANETSVANTLCVCSLRGIFLSNV